MHISYTCLECQSIVTSEFSAKTRELVCPDCGHAVVTPEGAVVDNDVERCLVCPSTDLFVRKDFSQALGITIIVIGFALSTVAWYYHQVIATYAILFATALIDAALYLVMGNVLQCYRCEAQYRDVASLADGPEFDLTVHEKHRQQEARELQKT